MSRPAALRGAPLLLALLAVGVGGCTLEPRADPNGNGMGGDSLPLEGEGPLDLPVLPADPEGSVRVTLEVFREAVRVGDLSLALGMLDARAVLLDDLASLPLGPGGIRLSHDGAGPGGAVRMQDPAATRGELLLELRRRHAAGLRMEVAEHEVRWLEDHVLVSSRLRLTLRPEDPDDPPGLLGGAVETALLRFTPEGWRIVHLHRSLGPVPPAREIEAEPGPATAP